MAPWLVSERARAEASARSILSDSAYDTAHATGRQQADEILARLIADGDAIPA